MKKIEMIIRPEKLEDVKEILNASKIYGMTVLTASGCGLQKGQKKVYRGVEISINLLPKIMVQIIVHDEQVEDIISKITTQIKTGNVGDGKIFVYNVEEAVRIRTGDRGDNAI